MTEGRISIETLLREVVSVTAVTIEAVGVAVLVIGAAAATFVFLRSSVWVPFPANYHGYRRNLGRAILLGLEFLVVGDIIRTVAVDPTITNVIVLGAIVLIRTFLSFSLEVEIDGRWPWQNKTDPEGAAEPRW
jgi:uncharacterized membrane protein